MRRALPLLVLGTLLVGPAGLDAGETPSPGPPWRSDWREAKQEALREGRPIFAYFTKKH